MMPPLLAGDQAALFSRLVQADHRLFLRINRDWTTPFLDGLLPFLRQSELWIPFYLFLLLLVTINFGRKGWWWAAAFIMTAVIGDLTSSSLMKTIVFRYRPCRSPDMEGIVRVLVNYCPKSSSFTSSHACNHFALAVFIFITLKQTGRWRWLVFLWAAAIAYAQVYVGVHYPADVVCGALLGCGIGYGMTVVFRRQVGPLSLK